MNNRYKNEKGITLVELLAVLVIAAIVMTLVMSIFSNGQKQSNAQITQAEDLNDVRYAAKVITKEIRMAERITWNGSRLVIGSDPPLTLTRGSDTILKDGVVFINNITITELDLIGQTIKFTMKSSNDEKTVATEIYIRGDDVIE